MQPLHNKPLDKWARSMLLSIKYQDHITRYFRLSIYTGVAIISFMGLFGIVSYVKALQTMFLSGLILVFGVAYLIYIRRAWLLGIQDPELKKLAHQAMIDFLAQKAGSPQQIRSRTIEANEEEECATCKI